MRVTISMPCYRRPQRTIRAIESILSQNIDGWEALIIGDNCPDMAKLIESNYFTDTIKDAESRGNSITLLNSRDHMAGFGYNVTNYNRSIAKGKYFVFLDNDDVITSDHLQNYLSGIENTHYDFVYFNSQLYQKKQTRDTQLVCGSIGHSELIIRTEFLRQMPPHSGHYGHDWELINNMMNRTRNHTKAYGKPATYYVMSTPDLRETGID